MDEQDTLYTSPQKRGPGNKAKSTGGLTRQITVRFAGHWRPTISCATVTASMGQLSPRG
jgi:hypothetical protein